MKTNIRIEVTAFFIGVLVSYLLGIITATIIMVFGGSDDMTFFESMSVLFLYAPIEYVLHFIWELPLIFALPFIYFSLGHFLSMNLLKEFKRKRVVAMFFAVIFSSVVVGLVNIYTRIKEVDGTDYAAYFWGGFLTTPFVLIIPVVAWSFYRWFHWRRDSSSGNRLIFN